MINYSPISGDPSNAPISYRPRACFLMTQLGGEISEELDQIRNETESVLDENNYTIIDANSLVTGKDFLLKIWELIVSVPLCVAIIHREMPTHTLCNIFYEIGMAQALGKETLVIKENDTEMPSDFVRTEYIPFNEQFVNQFNNYLNGLDNDRVNYYDLMADSLENNPLLAIDYLRRAFLLSGNEQYRVRAKAIYNESKLEQRARNSVEMLLINF